MERIWATGYRSFALLEALESRISAASVEIRSTSIEVLLEKVLILVGLHRLGLICFLRW